MTEVVEVNLVRVMFLAPVKENVGLSVDMFEETEKFEALIRRFEGNIMSIIIWDECSLFNVMLIE
jgi:hypothetical protein